MTKAIRISILSCILAFAAGGRLPGQMMSSRIYGSVQNEEGKFLAGVEVTAINVANNAQTKVYSSGAKGTFSFLSLAPGAYQVSCDLKGYHSYVAAGIRLSAGESTTLRVTMKRLPGADGDAPGEEPVPDAPADAGPVKTWQVELSAGVFFTKPDDLNSFVRTDLAAASDLPVGYYRQYRTSGLSTFNTFGRPGGKLRRLDELLPLMARLRFSLNRKFSLAAGIARSDRGRASAYSFAYDFFNTMPEANHLPPGRFTVISEFPAYRLEVKTLFPHAGAQFVLDEGLGFRLAGFAHAGWIFAKGRFASLKIVHDGLLERETTREMALEGRGSGPALETGVRLDMDVWRGLGGFIEVGYLLSRVTRMTGKSAVSETVRDLKTLETLSSVTENREGRWWTSKEYYSFPSVRPDGGPENGSPFALDLSGPGIRAGLLFRF